MAAPVPQRPSVSACCKSATTTTPYKQRQQHTQLDRNREGREGRVSESVRVGWRVGAPYGWVQHGRWKKLRKKAKKQGCMGLRWFCANNIFYTKIAFDRCLFDGCRAPNTETQSNSFINRECDGTKLLGDCQNVHTQMYMYVACTYVHAHILLCVRTPAHASTHGCAYACTPLHTCVYA